jgi:inner membrane protein
MNTNGAGGTDLRILGMTVGLWPLLSWVALSVFITLFTNWVLAGFRRPVWSRRFYLGQVTTILANLVWLLLLTVTGILAIRYIERMRSAVLGYLAFGLGILLLSLVRAYFYRGVQAQLEQQTQEEMRSQSRTLVHNSSYVLFALVLYLVPSWLVDHTVRPLFFFSLCIGALLPDLDSQNSVLGRLLPFLSRPLETRLGHRQQWHSLTANAFIVLITSPLILLIGLEAWYLVPLAFFSHLILDMLTPQGLMLFWPVTDTRYFIFGGPIKSPGDRIERRLAASFAIGCALLLLVVDMGPPKPSPVTSLSYEQTIECYYALRGRNLVSADIEGTWQATGRRMSGRFEVLNAANESFIMRDCYDGKVFSAGRSGSENLYLNRITLQPGAPVRVKPAEIHLHDEPLAAALPVLYQMQREPGLRHIFISGDVIIPGESDPAKPSLPIDYAQTALRRIQARGLGQYRLYYLTASELIELANQQVSTADLAIVGTYVTPTAGPTVTPLPSLPPTPEPVP